MADVLNLPDYLRETGGSAFVWGHSDCCLWAADWVQQVRGVDPARPLRGHYGTAFAAYREIARRGGFLPMVSDLMARCAFEVTEDPQPGDIGVVITRSGPMIGIRTKIGWAVKSISGFECLPLRCQRAWSVA